MDEWNLSIQQEVARDTILQVGYLGTKGTHLFRKGLSLNGIDPVTGRRPYASLTNFDHWLDHVMTPTATWRRCR